MKIEKAIETARTECRKAHERFMENPSALAYNMCEQSMVAYQQLVHAQRNGTVRVYLPRDFWQWYGVLLCS